jgi:tRNA(His) 5'-end guanylyltransferase
MKLQYEDRTRYCLPRRTYTILRLDGKAFHTYTRNLEKPFDDKFEQDLDNAVRAILPEIQGAQFAYIQSDEISILLTDFAEINTCAWFDGNIQKITSVAASLMTAEFNKLRMRRKIYENKQSNPCGLSQTYVDGCLRLEKCAYFDARVFTISEPVEVYNYFVWRNKDTARNSLSSMAQSLYSIKELQGKNGREQHRMILLKNIDWEEFDPRHKFGRIISKKTEFMPPAFPNQKMRDAIEEDPETFKEDFTFTRWKIESAWKFQESADRLQKLIPSLPQLSVPKVETVGGPELEFTPKGVCSRSNKMSSELFKEIAKDCYPEYVSPYTKNP